MDQSKPLIAPCKSRLRSASKRIPADIDPAPARPDERVAVYYRTEEEVTEGFLIALRAMGIAAAEPCPEPAKPPIRRAKP
jgi:hypothetical protein